MAESGGLRAQGQSGLGTVPHSTELIDSLQANVVLSVAVICKQIAEENGERLGELVCPVCRTGTLTWHLARNGHVSYRCDRLARDGSHCLLAME